MQLFFDMKEVSHEKNLDIKIQFTLYTQHTML